MSEMNSGNSKDVTPEFGGSGTVDILADAVRAAVEKHKQQPDEFEGEPDKVQESIAFYKGAIRSPGEQ